MLATGFKQWFINASIVTRYDVGGELLVSNARARKTRESFKQIRERKCERKKEGRPNRTCLHLRLNLLILIGLILISQFLNIYFSLVFYFVLFSFIYLFFFFYFWPCGSSILLTF